MNISIEDKKFFITHSGVKVYPSDLSTLDIKLEDIAHHLANTERFGGALGFDKTYSVAHHSVLMAKYALEHFSKDVARACLLHDATEAYLGDVVSPLKSVLSEYKVLETQLFEMIYLKFNVKNDVSISSVVQKIDRHIILDEVKNLIPHQYDLFKQEVGGIDPLGIRVIDVHMNKRDVYDAFLYWADYLNIRG